MVEALGFALDSSSNKALAESLDKIVLPDNEMANKLIRIMATRSMCQAYIYIYSFLSILSLLSLSPLSLFLSPSPPSPL